MTAQKSNNKFAINYFTRLKANKKFMGIIFIMHMLAAPLFLLMSIITINKLNTANHLGQYTDWDGSLAIYMVIAVITTGVAALCGIFVALGNFNYLYKKQNVDMVYALPITTDQRFFSDYLSGLTTYIAPFLASGIFTIILSFITQSVYENSSFFNGDLKLINNMTIPEIAIKLILFGTILMIVLYTLSVFATTFSGNLVFAVGNVVALNVIIPVSILLIAEVFVNNNYGLDNSYGFLPILYGTSPAGGLGYVLNYFIGESIFGYFQYTFNTNYVTAFILPLLAISLAMFIGAYFLNKFRKTEDVSKPYPYKVFYYIIMAFVTFIVASIFALSDTITEMLFPAVIVLAVVWLIISVILNKGFKNIAKTGIQFVITVGIVLTLLVTNYKTEGFGVVYRQPDLNDIKSISTNYSGIFSNLGERWSNNIVSTIDDKQYIKLFYETHKDILDEYKENKEDSYVYGSNTKFNITYNLKNGKKMTRSYRVNSTPLEKISSLDLTDEYIDQVIDYQIEKFEQQVKERENIQSLFAESTIPARGLDIDFGLNYNNKSFDEEYNKAYLEKLSNKTNEFFEAVRKDLKSLSPEDYYSPTQKSICTLQINNFEIVINKNYTNVLKWLSENDVDLSELEYTDADISEFYFNMSIGKYSNQDNNILISGNSDGYSIKSESLDTEIKDYEKEDMLTLMQNAQPNYYSASDIYVLKYRNWTFAIPPQYNDIAEKYATSNIEEYLQN